MGSAGQPQNHDGGQEAAVARVRIAGKNASGLCNARLRLKEKGGGAAPRRPLDTKTPPKEAWGTSPRKETNWDREPPSFHESRFALTVRPGKRRATQGRLEVDMRPEETKDLPDLFLHSIS